MTPHRLYAFLALCLLAVGLVFSLPARAPDLVIPWQETTKLSLFQAPKAQGTVLIVHSVYQDKETTYPLARVLRDSGLNAVSVHLSPGRAFHEYVATLKSLCRRFEKDGPLYAVGHSMGADLICTLAAEDESVQSVVVLGFPANTELLNCPVLLGAGAWDQVHSRETIEAAAKGSPTLFSPFCDHSQESLDHTLQNGILQHFGREQTSFRGNSMLGHGLVVLGLSLFVFLVFPVSLAGRKPAAALLVLVLLVSLLKPSGLVSALGLGLYLGVALSNARIEERAGLVIPALIQFGLLVLSVMLFWGLYRYTAVLADPKSLLGLPLAVISWLPILLARVSHAGSSPTINWVILVLTSAEFVAPGALFGYLLRFLERQRVRLHNLKFQGTSRPSWPQIAVLSGLAVVALLLWKQVGAAGYQLEFGDFARLGWKFFALLLGPAGLYLFLNSRKS